MAVSAEPWHRPGNCYRYWWKGKPDSGQAQVSQEAGYMPKSRVRGQETRQAQILGPAPGAASSLLLTPLQTEPDPALTFTGFSQLNLED